MNTFIKFEGCTNPMTVRNYYRCTLALPILLPLIEIGIRWRDSGYGDIPWEHTSILGWSLLYGGVPYLFVAAIMLYRLRNKEDTEIPFLAVQAPLIMCPFQFLYTFYLANGDFMAGLVYSFYTVPIAFAFGYGYVAIAIGGMWLFRLLELVSPTNPE